VAGAGGLSSPAPRVLPVCLLAAGFFASGTARLYLVPFHALAAGAGSAEIGVLFSAIQVAAAAASIPAGLLADRWGHRRVLAVAALLGAVNLVVISRTSSYPLELVLQMLGGASGSAGMAVCMALVAAGVEPRRMGRAVAWLTLANQVGYLLGPALAALLLQWLSVDDDLVVSGCLALSVTALLPLLPRRGQAGARAGVGLVDVLALVRRREVMAVFFGMIAATLLWGTVEAYLPLLATDQLGLPASVVGAVIALQALLNAAARFPAGWLADRLRWRSPAVVALTAAYGALLVVATLVPGLAGGLVLAGAVVAIAAAFVLLATSFASLAGETNRGAVMGVYGAGLFVGLALGPLAFGPLVEAAGYTVGLGACAGTATMLSLTALLAVGRPPASERVAAAGAGAHSQR
jgi:MFS family permease